jgi:hypothetical protein
VLVTSVFKIISSSGRPVALAVDCIIAVKNDIGLKSPEIHTDGGAISSSEYWSIYVILNKRSSNHEMRFLSEK